MKGKGKVNRFHVDGQVWNQNALGLLRVDLQLSAIDPPAAVSPRSRSPVARTIIICPGVSQRRVIRVDGGKEVTDRGEAVANNLPLMPRD